MVLPWAVAVNQGEKLKKIKSVVYVATEHLDTTLMQFRASLAKLSFGATRTKGWCVYLLSLVVGRLLPSVGAYSPCHTRMHCLGHD